MLTSKFRRIFAFIVAIFALCITIVAPAAARAASIAYGSQATGFDKVFDSGWYLKLNPESPKITQANIQPVSKFAYRNTDSNYCNLYGEMLVYKTTVNNGIGGSSDGATLKVTYPNLGYLTNAATGERGTLVDLELTLEIAESQYHTPRDASFVNEPEAGRYVVMGIATDYARGIRVSGANRVVQTCRFIDAETGQPITIDGAMWYYQGSNNSGEGFVVQNAVDGGGSVSSGEEGSFNVNKDFGAVDPELRNRFDPNFTLHTASGGSYLYELGEQGDGKWFGYLGAPLPPSTVKYETYSGNDTGWGFYFNSADREFLDHAIGDASKTFDATSGWPDSWPFGDMFVSSRYGRSGSNYLPNGKLSITRDYTFWWRSGAVLAKMSGDAFKVQVLSGAPHAYWASRYGSDAISADYREGHIYKNELSSAAKGAIDAMLANWSRYWSSQYDVHGDQAWKYELRDCILDNNSTTTALYNSNNFFAKKSYNEDVASGTSTSIRGIWWVPSFTPLTEVVPEDPIKAVDKAKAELTDTVTYTVTVPTLATYGGISDGVRYEAFDFTDTIPTGLTYVANSFKVTHKTDTSAGVRDMDITANGAFSQSGQTIRWSANKPYLNGGFSYNGYDVVITFKAKVDSELCQSTPIYRVVNKASVDYGPNDPRVTNEVTTEILLKGWVKLNKVSSNDSWTSQFPSTYSRAGAKYSVTDAAGANVGTLTTLADGSTNTLELDPGKYTVKETQASPGFSLDPNSYTVTVEPNKTATVTSTEPLAKSGLQLLKSDSELR